MNTHPQVRILQELTIILALALTAGCSQEKAKSDKIIPQTAAVATNCKTDPVAAAMAADPTKPLGFYYECWQNVAGSHVADLTSNSAFPGKPSETKILPRAEFNETIGDECGVRLRARLHVPKKGEYQFWVAGDDQAELWLSPNDTPDKKRQICSCPKWANAGDFDKYPEQHSSALLLNPGQEYYIEVLLKQDRGGSSLAVAWEGPGVRREIIPAVFLTAFQAASGR